MCEPIKLLASEVWLLFVIALISEPYLVWTICQIIKKKMKLGQCYQTDDPWAEFCPQMHFFLAVMVYPENDLKKYIS